MFKSAFGIVLDTKEYDISVVYYAIFALFSKGKITFFELFDKFYNDDFRLLCKHVSNDNVKGKYSEFADIFEVDNGHNKLKLKDGKSLPADKQITGYLRRKNI